jgi:hypothetical protein
MAGAAVRASTANAETGTDKPATIPEGRSGDAGATVAGRGSGPATATVEIVIPVYNEQRALPGCIEVLTGYLIAHFPFDWTITIVDNASTDDTPTVADELAHSVDRVRVLRLGRKGRGLALRSSWSDSTADVVVYMDVDLSTGLDALLPLVASVADGHSDIAIGSRLAPGARTIRGAKREVISRCYNALIRLTHGARFSDAQCGFKAAHTAVVRPLLAHIRNDAWFFDTELLLLAEHNGLRVHEVPVDWVEDTDTRVHLRSAVTEDLRGLLRVARAKASGAAKVAGCRADPSRDRSIRTRYWPDVTAACSGRSSPSASSADCPPWPPSRCTRSSGTGGRRWSRTWSRW